MTCFRRCRTSGLLAVVGFSTLVGGVEGREVEQCDASASTGGITNGVSNAGDRRQWHPGSRRRPCLGVVVSMYISMIKYISYLS